jgi:hypothetical protein
MRVLPKTECRDGGSATQAFIATREIRALEVRREDQAGTIGLIAGLVGVAGLTATLITEAGEPSTELR